MNAARCEYPNCGGECLECLPAGSKPPANTVSLIADEELLRRAVGTARAWRGGRQPRWVAVMDTFLLGSTFATQLCRRFGIDPDEMVKR